jgi:transposase-like protein
MVRLPTLAEEEAWHLDEMVVRIAGKRMYLWRAVDHEGEVLDFDRLLEMAVRAFDRTVLVRYASIA